MGRRVFRWLGRERGFLDPGQRRLKRIGDALRDFTLDREDIGQGPIVGFGPEVAVRLRVDQLHIDAHPIAGFLDAAFEDMRDAELFCDFGRFSGALL